MALGQLPIAVFAGRGNPDEWRLLFLPAHCAWQEGHN
jgi:hypothetical protein